MKTEKSKSVKDYNKIIEEVNEKLTHVNRKVFKLRVKRRRYGITLEENYKFRQLVAYQRRLKEQIKGLTNKL